MKKPMTEQELEITDGSTQEEDEDQMMLTYGTHNDHETHQNHSDSVKRRLRVLTGILLGAVYTAHFGYSV